MLFIVASFTARANRPISAAHVGELRSEPRKFMDSIMSLNIADIGGLHNISVVVH